MDDRTARIELRRKDEPSLWAYDAAAVATWGEYACLNFPESEAVA
jgi:hypothetical protein